jgi:hypothetical protein
MWNEFDALAGVPLLVFCGANSDILFGRDGNGHADASSRNAGYRSGEPGPRLFDVEDLLRRVADFVARGSACFTGISPRSQSRPHIWLSQKKSPKKKNPGGPSRQGFQFQALIRRSGQKVLVDAAGDREVVLVLESGKLVHARWGGRRIELSSENGTKATLTIV